MRIQGFASAERAMTPPSLFERQIIGFPFKSGLKTDSQAVYMELTSMRASISFTDRYARHNERHQRFVRLYRHE